MRALPARVAIALACLLVATGCTVADRPEYRIEAAQMFIAPTPVEVVVDPDRSRRLVLPGADAIWHAVRLPYRVRRGQAAPGEPDTNTHRVWIRIRYQVPDGQVEPLAIYLPRLMAGFGTGDFLIDGERIESGLGPGGNQWNMPFLLAVPEVAQRRGSFEVLVSFWNWREAGFMLAVPYIGPISALRPLADERRFYTSDAPRGMAYALAVLGLFAFGSWLRRRAETTYLLFAVASAVWYLRTLHYYTGVPDQWIGVFWWVSLNSLSWLMLVVYLFAMRFQSRAVPLLERGLVGLIVLTTCVTLPFMPLTNSEATGIAYGSQLLVALAVTGWLTLDALRRRAIETQVLVVALWINLVFGAHDLLLHRFRLDAEHLFLMPYGALVLFGAFLFAVTRRYAAALNEVERVNASLEARLVARTQELAESYEKLQRVEKERAVVDERQRLMREMHDGLGSSLMSSLVMVEQGRLSANQVATVLRECIDDLKLTIDSLEPIGQDLVTLLATLRYRLGRRLEQAGLKLDWQVGDLPALPWLDAVTALQVLRIIQEALTNVVKHSGARTVRIATDVVDGTVQVRVSDDGVGLDAARTEGGRGLMNMRRRAEQLGGQIEFARDAGWTQVTLRLPVDRRRTQRQSPDSAVSS
jgi:signal transduction histidine kinase